MRRLLPRGTVRVTIAALLVASVLAASGVAAGATTTSVALDPAASSAAPGETVTVAVQLDEVDNGVTSYQFDAAVNDTSVAAIRDVALVGSSPDDAGTSVQLADDGSNVSVAVAAGDHDDGVVAYLTVEAVDAGAAALSLDDVVLGDDDFRSYTVSGTEGTTLDVGQYTDVSLEPAVRPVPSDGTATLDVVVENPERGVRAFEFVASVGNASRVGIVGVDPVGASADDVGTDVTVAPDGSNASVAVAAGDHDDGTIATVRLEARATGTANVTLHGVVVGTDNNTAYRVGERSNATVEVRAPPEPVTGGDEPTDVDGDGTFEDVNGDGEFNILDIGALLQHRNSPAVQEHVAFWDTNGDGEFNILDIGKNMQRLFG